MEEYVNPDICLSEIVGEGINYYDVCKHCLHEKIGEAEIPDSCKECLHQWIEAPGMETENKFSIIGLFQKIFNRE